LQALQRGDHWPVLPMPLDRLQIEPAKQFSHPLLLSFAGSGAIGLEAQSRGASIVHAVEKDFGAHRTINENIEIVAAAKPAGKFQLFAMTAEQFVKVPAKIKYEIVYIDPPYDYPNSDLEEMLSNLHLGDFLSDDSLIAVERTSRSKEPIWPIGFELARSKNYGQATIYYLNHA
jgi:16S rRNA (guanine966-N2)-methyltransferase